jgi:putative exosortase-associated protein (TIGR04073 family)
MGISDGRPRRRHGARLALALAGALTLATPALAASTHPVHRRAPAYAPHYTAPRKLGRGLAAMTCGFLELPGNVVLVTRQRGPAWGVTLGFVQGLGRIVVRELVGVYEFVTGPFPVPAGYRPIIEPEFPWGYFD